ncbi:hypothetical protein FACS1894170_12280 [Planctomycetales bacterium]|nr:hypothetical protein FACS1894170_12280 [Planctomycetales bacterium]
MSNLFFTKRRYHNAENKPDETVESFLKKKRFAMSLCLGLGIPLGILGVIGMVSLFRYPDPPVWIACLAVCSLAAIPFIAVCLESYRNFKDCSLGLLGRWVITSHGIHHCFGKSPARFVTWSDVHAIRYDARKKQIILETADTPLAISTWAQKPVDTPILPFLNKLIEILESLPINIEPLLSLQEKERKKYIAQTYCPVTDGFNELHLLLTWGLPVVGLGVAINVYVQEYIRQSGIEPDTHFSGLFAAACFVLTPISFYVCRAIKHYHVNKVETIYQSLLSGETVEILDEQKGILNLPLKNAYLRNKEL